MAQRIYTDDEVRRILQAATELPAGDPAEEEQEPGPVGPGKSGLTLPELREIGIEAGIDPARIEAAAQGLDRPPATSRKEVGVLGQPRRLAREIPLPGPYEGEDWSHLVALLRGRFGGNGEVEGDAPLHGWKREGVTAHQEPDPLGDGWRLRIEVEPTEMQEALELTELLLLGGVILVLVGLFTEASVMAAHAGALLVAAGGAAGGWILGRSFPRWEGQQTAILEEVARDAARIGTGKGAHRSPPADS